MRSHSRQRAAAVVLATALIAGLGGCGDEDDPSAEDPAPSDGTTAATPTESPIESPSETPNETPSEPSPSASDTGSAGTDDVVAVPVYFAGETPIGPRLYREFRNVEADNPLEEAVALMTAGDALDGDYRTLFPGGGFASVTFSEGAGAIVAQVPDDGWITPPEGMSRREAKLAVQQLVYTVQGIQQERLPVLVQLGDSPVRLFGIDTSKGLRAAKPLKVLAFVNVTTPEEGATVPDTFTASGVASSFEGTVPWEVRDESGAAVLEGFGQAAGFVNKLYPWESQVDVSGLQPGTYTFAALTDDPSDGEGAGPTEDTKTITVE